MFRKFTMNIKKTISEFPRKFWIIVGVMFIDRIGGTMLFPFFSLYITGKFGVGMTEAGMILGMFSIFGMIGAMFGGALTDRFGRRKLILFGLVFSALSTLSLGLVNQFALLYPLAMVIGLLGEIAGPAHQAMIADVLPEDKRNEGFGIMRVIANLAWIIGPTIGGLVAGESYFMLFIIDAVISCIVAVLFYFLISETKPEHAAGASAHSEGILKTFIGYGKVLKDLAFLAFTFAMMLMGMIYQQMYNSLSVYLRDTHGIDPRGYGFLLTSSAIVVIFFQFWTTRVIKKRPPFVMMAFGTIFYMIGFSMFGFVSAYWLFVLAVVIITVGEMINMPTSQALAANFAPEDMRGRYMAVYGLSYGIPAIVGPVLAGLVLDHLNPNYLWYGGGLLCLLSSSSFLLLQARIGRQARFLPKAEPGAAASIEPH
jgi:MFS family permease